MADMDIDIDMGFDEEDLLIPEVEGTVRRAFVFCRIIKLIMTTERCCTRAKADPQSAQRYL